MKNAPGNLRARIANGILILAGVGCLLVFASAVWLRGSHLAGRAYARYAFSLFGAVFCFCALRFKVGLRQRAALVILSSAVSLYALEAVLWFHPVNAVDLRGKYHEVLRARRHGTRAVPDISPRLFLRTDGFPGDGGRIFPLGGIANRLTVLCAEGGDYTVYESDEHGFHNPKGMHETAGIEIALVGDSFIQGACVPDGEDIAGHLRARGRIVLALGAMGAGPLVELALLTEYAAPVKPRNVFWFYFEGNDLSDLSKEKRSDLLLRYLKRAFSQGLRSRQTTIDQALDGFVDKHLAVRSREEFFLSGPMLFLGLAHVRARLKLLTLEQSPDLAAGRVDPLLGEILNEAAARTESWGGRFFLVYLPAWERFARHERRFPRDRVLAMAHQLGIQTIDIADFFSQQPDPLSFYPSRIFRHYTSEGYAHIAEIIEAAAGGSNPEK